MVGWAEHLLAWVEMPAHGGTDTIIQQGISVSGEPSVFIITTLVRGDWAAKVGTQVIGHGELYLLVDLVQQGVVTASVAVARKQPMEWHPGGGSFCGPARTVALSCPDSCRMFGLHYVALWVGQPSFCQVQVDGCKFPPAVFFIEV
jgi:hypothetical protein